MRVLFVVEVGMRCGLGHLMRCRSLMLAMDSRGIRADLWLRGEPGALDGRRWPEAMQIWVSSDDVGVEELETKIVEHVTRMCYDWVIVDGYGFSGPSLHERVAARGVRLLILDDVADRVLKADVLLNQNTERAEMYLGGAAQAHRFLLGPRYALIAPEYRGSRWKSERHEEMKRVLISFGGVDREGRTEKALAHLASYGATLDVDVVLGPYHPFEKELRAYDGPHRLHIHQGLKCLAALMANADIMVSAAGSTVWEACCVGVPLIAVQTRENQREVTRTVAMAGAALCVPASSLDQVTGERGENLFLRLFRRAEDLAVRRALSMKARSLVDGRGAERLVDLLTSRSVFSTVTDVRV